MKIEKVNDNQIRCTLTKEDLASRQLKISELAYGTEKAKNLFRDMMQQANYEFGFEAEDFPLMIEAIPMNAECIVLVVTKVEDPEELDTRFARFAPSVHEDSESETDNEIQIEGSKDILDLIPQFQVPPPEEESMELPFSTESPQLLIRLFKFDRLHTLLDLVSNLDSRFTGDSSLYKATHSDAYLLLLTCNPAFTNDFNKLCNCLSEYGTPQKVLFTTPSYLSEHCECIISANALHVLANI